MEHMPRAGDHRGAIDTAGRGTLQSGAGTRPFDLAFRARAVCP